MKKRYIIIFVLLVVSQAKAQDKFFTKTGYVSFYSHSLVEDIKADNNQCLSIIDAKTGKIAIKILMRSFMFKKALMQEHFNENYIESYKYPKAIFSGVIQNFKELNSEVNETEVIGVLKIHGKEKEIAIRLKVVSKENEIILSGSFNVEVADFNIKIPSIVSKNIAKTIEISFELNHKPYK